MMCVMCACVCVSFQSACLFAYVFSLQNGFQRKFSIFFFSVRCHFSWKMRRENNENEWSRKGEFCFVCLSLIVACEMLFCEFDLFVCVINNVLIFSNLFFFCSLHKIGDNCCCCCCLNVRCLLSCLNLMIKL